MIVDKLNKLSQYLPPIAATDVIKLLENEQLLNQEAGCYTLDSGLQYHIKRHNTHPDTDSEFETHEKFADLQIVLAGEETIGYIPRRDDLEVTVEYNKDDDITFYKNDEQTRKTMSRIALAPGMFTILYPQDVHMPGLNTRVVSSAVRKIVVKLPLELPEGWASD